MNTLPLTPHDSELPLQYVELSILHHGLPRDVFAQLLGTYNACSSAPTPFQTMVLQSLLKNKSTPVCVFPFTLLAPLVYHNMPFDIVKTPHWDVLCDIFNHTVPVRVENFEDATPPDLQFKMLLTLLCSNLTSSLKKALKKDVFETWSAQRLHALLNSFCAWGATEECTADIFAVLLKNLRAMAVSHAFLSSLALLVSARSDLTTVFTQQCRQITPYLKDNWETLVAPYIHRSPNSQAQIWDALSFVVSNIPKVELQNTIIEKCLQYFILRVRFMDTEEKLKEYGATYSCQNMAHVFEKFPPQAVCAFFTKKVDQSHTSSSGSLEQLAVYVDRMCALGLNMDAVLHDNQLVWSENTPHVLDRLSYLQSLRLHNALSSPAKPRIRKEKKI